MHEGSMITVPEDKRLLLKHIDANNIAILTKYTGKEENYINLVILNTFSGRIIFTAK